MLRIGRHPLLSALAAALLLAFLAGCHGSPEPEAMTEGTAPEKPRPSFNHEAHLNLPMDLSCDLCHEPDSAGVVSAPAMSVCWDCHDENPKEWPEKFAAFFASIKQDDGTYAFSEVPYSPDLRMDHGVHAAAGVSCAECHGEPAETAFTRPPLMELKQNCMGCHEQRGASNDCATCHREIRDDVAPPSHAADSFAMAHGKMAPASWKQGDGGLCALCHETPQDCTACHTERVPASHLNAIFRRDHGRAVEDGLFEDTSCSLCHEEQSCQQCHQTERPRSHTVAFERRLHGVVAAVDRETCRTCHQQESCDRCHSETRPVSHRGSWGAGRQTHCISCHEPLQSTSCATCHKDTLGHLQATPMPPGWPHNTATQCRECHMIVPHVDSGGDGDACKRCHRILR